MKRTKGNGEVITGIKSERRRSAWIRQQARIKYIIEIV